LGAPSNCSYRSNMVSGHNTSRPLPARGCGNWLTQQHSTTSCCWLSAVQVAERMSFEIDVNDRSALLQVRSTQPSAAAGTRHFAWIYLRSRFVVQAGGQCLWRHGFCLQREDQHSSGCRCVLEHRVFAREEKHDAAAAAERSGTFWRYPGGLLSWWADSWGHQTAVARCAWAVAMRCRLFRAAQVSRTTTSSIISVD
jgi:hypothetical protein